VLRPTTGELLDGVRRELAAQVLPALPRGAEYRQLKAALHVLGQVSATWDGAHTVLRADNADLAATLDVLRARTGLSPEATWAVEPVGVGDPELRDLMARNAALQAEVEDLQERWRADSRLDVEVDRLLLQLHLRCAGRAGADVH
jgi:hypothetical protein